MVLERRVVAGMSVFAYRVCPVGGSGAGCSAGIFVAPFFGRCPEAQGCSVGNTDIHVYVYVTVISSQCVQLPCSCDEVLLGTRD